MIITHKIKKDYVQKKVFNTVERNLSVFMLNRKGSYFAVPANPKDNITHMNGFMNIVDYPDGYTLYKSIDNIHLNKDATEIINNYINVERIYSDSKERFTLAKNGLMYEVESYSEYIYLDLDFREIFNTDDKGRIYNIYKHEDLIIIEYTKYADNSLSWQTGKSFLAIKGAGNSEKIDAWTQKNYSYDNSRKNATTMYVYNALKIPCSKNIKLYFSFSLDKDDAVKKVNDLFMGSAAAEELNIEYLENVLSAKNDLKQISTREESFAYAASINALDSFAMKLPLGHKNITGMWAGLPWFFQYWSRDELISAASLILEHRYEYGKELLMKYLSEIMPDGRLSNRYPTANLGTADSIGWLFKRIQGFLSVSEQRDNFHNYFSMYDLKFIHGKLEFSIKKLLENHSHNGLIINDKQETWMDTFNPDTYDKDFREGTRIEIQALFLAQLKLLGMLDVYISHKDQGKGSNGKSSEKIKYALNAHELEMKTRQLVRDKFLRKENGRLVLNDGYDCPMSDVTRPNIFLAYYIYPELLSTEEWNSVFDHALSKLWCDWDMGEGVKGGGLSTIDKSHYLYQPYYTGSDNKSYHRGDSWMWINNIAAVAMHRLDKKKYSEYVREISSSSAQDILYFGFIGYASELGSSGWYKCGGCLAQTWSIATYIELMHELYIDE